MRKILDIPVGKIIPEKREVFSLQGIPEGADVSQRINNLYEEAFSTFTGTMEPRGLISEISSEDLTDILTDIRGNIFNSVLSTIFRKSENLALFVFTLGNTVSDKITQLFSENDFALGSMLDSVASASADSGPC